MSKTTPGYIHNIHSVMTQEYSGDENLHIGNHLEVIDNYVYIDGINTGINVKGDPGPAGESAYQSYVNVCKDMGITPLSEKDWVETFDTVTIIEGGGTIDAVQSDYEETDTTELSYIKNKPLKVLRDTGSNIIEVEFE